MQALNTPQSCLTDFFNVCNDTGIGCLTNQIHRDDGEADHQCTSSFKFNDNFYWYTVFDGQGSKRAADFCSKQMLADVYFGKITEWKATHKEIVNERKTDEEIKELLRNAFVSVEKSYMLSLDDLLAERANLLYNIPDGLSVYEAYKNDSNTLQRLQQINYELSSGATAAVALIYNKKLYVANVGNCRVLLCQTDANSVLKVVQLSIDHDFNNEDELIRLAQIGVNTDKLAHNFRLRNQMSTRCLGNYLLKGDYKEYDELSSATQEPIIAEPDVHGGIQLDESYRFLLLMSEGLYKPIEEVTGTDQVNKYIAQCTVEQFRKQPTLNGVAQAVVNEAVRCHHIKAVNNPTTPKRDVTLVLRNFNYPLPNAAKLPAAATAFSSAANHNPFRTDSSSATTNSTVRTGSSSDERSDFNTLAETDKDIAVASPTKPTVRFNPVVARSGSDGTNTITDRNSVNSSSAVTTSSSEETNETAPAPVKRIDAYVDFTEFIRSFEQAKLNGTLPDGIDF